MELSLVLLLAGLIVIGIAIPSFFIEKGGIRSFGVKLQMFFGVMLVVAYLLIVNNIIRL